MKSVSIIIPVFNTEAFVKDCLHSVFGQTYDHLEIILIDNGSDAVCQSVLDELQKEDERVKLYRLEENCGPGYARNFGIQQATGDYVYFLDSDDYLPRETIALLMEHVGEYPLIVGNIRDTFLSKGMTVVFPGHITPKLYKSDRMELLHSLHALNWLIDRHYVIEHALAFSESYDLFNDIPFMIPPLKEIAVIPYVNEAIYFKRTRNDPILQPSMKQRSHKSYMLSFFQMYHDNKDRHEQIKVQKELDVQLLKFYRERIISYFDGKVAIEELFSELAQAMKRVDKKLLADTPWFTRREGKSIRRGNQKAYKRIHSQHQLLRDLKQGVKGRTRFYKFLYKHAFLRLPLKDNLVFFESFLGKNYSDNPKYIYEYLDKHHPQYKPVWSLNKKTSLPGKAKQVRRGGLRYFYTLARAKYWVSNSRMPIYLKKRNQGVYLQTWHGTPLKRLVFDMADVYSADPRYKNNFYIQSRRWDYLNAANAYSTDVFRRAFQYDKQMLEYGYPRNDILYQKDNPENILKLKKQLGVPTDKKIVLYAPTWRDDDFVAKGKYNFTLELDLKDMQKKLGSEYIVILRMHYFIAEQLDIREFEGFAFNFSNHDDIAELYLISDLLITDYSSVFFDYAHLQRPIMFFTFDLEKYRDQLRGFYLDIETELPGPLLHTSDEVLDAISNLDKLKADYADKYASFYDRFCNWDDGNASRRTVETVFLGKGDEPTH